MAKYIFNHFRYIPLYFKLPIGNNNRPGSIRLDAETIRQLRDIEARRNRRIVSFGAGSPLLENRTNYNSPHDNTHWAWQAGNFGAGLTNGKWVEVSANSGPWIGNLTSVDIELTDQPEPTQTPKPTITPTQSITPQPTITPTKTTTPSITPTITRTVTPSVTVTETVCPFPTPTPTITPNLNVTDCLLHIRLVNLKPNSIYRSLIRIMSDTSTIIPKPSQIGFWSMNDGTQNLWILLNRVGFNESVPINIETRIVSTARVEAEEYEADHVVNVLFTRDCGCSIPAECPAEVISVSNDMDTTVNYNGCIVCNDNDTNTESSDIGRVPRLGTVGTLGFDSHYGTYDQSGNVWEWTESGPIYKTRRYLRGGSYLSSLMEIDSRSLLSRKSSNISSYSSELGFRIATYTNPNDIPCFIDVSDPCNIPDKNGFGRVKTPYKIHKYTVTNYDYMTFLNSVSSDKSSDALGLYKPEMEDDITGGIIRKFNTLKQRYEYATKPNMEYKPVNFVSWIDSVRYCNWLHNLHTTTNTEDGAYNLSDLSLIPTNLLVTKSSSNIIDNLSINTALISKDRIWTLSAFEQSKIDPVSISKKLPSVSDIIIDNSILNNTKGLSIDIVFKENLEVLGNMLLTWCGYSISSSALRTSKKAAKRWNIFIPRYLINRDGGYSLSMGTNINPSFQIAARVLRDPLLIFFVIDQDNSLLNINPLSFEATNCYRDFTTNLPININIERSLNAKYFLPTENEWYKAAYYDADNTAYYKHATKSNKMPLCPYIDKDGNGPYYHDVFCNCPEIKICDVELTDISNNDYTFALSMTKNIDCCKAEYKLVSSSNISGQQNWTPIESALIDCDPYFYPPILCNDIIP
jgi:formylglycine-generating enzyme required for sulfatase activity